MGYLVPINRFSLFLFKLFSMRKILLSFLVVYSLLVFSCNNPTTTTTEKATVDSSASVGEHPAWIMQGNIYEVNVRQYTPEGTFGAFENHLQRLKDMGVQTLWFMPINPISKKDHKGALGSYYAVSNYSDVNPEFGNMDDWKHLVKKAHDMNFKVIIDWVPNHSGADHPWMQSHPDFYVHDSAGNFISPFDWTDVRKLNYQNPELVDSMIASMKFWVTQTGIDGFRCDHAVGPGIAFWKKSIPELKKTKNLLMIAEAEEPWIYDVGFDMSYAWQFFHVTVDIVAGKRKASSLDTVLHMADSIFNNKELYMCFTSNHDENSWNKADYKTMPGASHAPFAVLTQTIEHGVPLIYSGQEEPFLDSVSFFYKDTITFSKLRRANFYKTLLNLRKNDPALAADASFKKLHTNHDEAIYAFEREKNGNKILVVLNLSKKPQHFTWKDQPSEKEWNNIFLYNNEPVDKGFGIEPWGYAVYELKK